MEEQAEDIAEAASTFVRALREEPGLAVLIGLIGGIFLKQVVNVVETLTIWFRLKLLGDKRKNKGGGKR